MRRTLRQEGLVDQHRLERLRVAVVDEGAGSSELGAAIGQLAGQLGVSPPLEYIDDGRTYDFLICLSDSCVPLTDTPYTRVQILDNGVRITSDVNSRSGSPSDLQEPGLCTIGSALAWQEVLRRTGVALPVEVPKKYITVNLRIDPSNLPYSEEPGDVLRIVGPGGDAIPFRSSSRDDGTGHTVLSARIDEGTELADSILGLIKLESSESDKSEPPAEIELMIPQCEGDVTGSVTVAGVGGLGSWAMHTVAMGIANSGGDGSGLSIHLVDPDTEVEVHNLNRQVLYTADDLGMPKAEVSARRISEILPVAEVRAYVDALGIAHLDGLMNPDGIIQNEVDDEEEMEIDFIEGFDDFAGISGDLLEALNSTDAVLSGVDNLRSRSVLSAISSHLGVPMINAGARGFVGSFDVFLGDQTCMVCRYGTQAVSQYRPMSCQEDGEVPFSAIVTSTALFGALEGLALISALCSGGSSLSDWPSLIIWSGWSNSFNCHEDHGFGPFKQAFLARGSHSEHLAELLFDAEVIA
ncbi:MAG TPA: ThiF family adenylyltransferase [Candidatus Poseidoniales archaeon]|nr:ThiF family adenylyltransferase [Candidatus Poseidoniales archaeon]